MITKLFMKTKIELENYKNNEQGVTAIEYGLIAAAIAVSISAVLTPMGTQLKAVFNTVLVAIGGSAV
ncbi:Flp family type IVb pilin [Vibrio lentus]|uniref:Flp family type IVb pilin n=1 Tax=Vibrio lentus TaxID=136468 RepID=UPI000C8361C0|nr:Flp family type IVb pilin [Vibrio lentus]PMI79654.1 pilus assembly protein [Vibrio lentus]